MRPGFPLPAGLCSRGERAEPGQAAAAVLASGSGNVPGARGVLAVKVEMDLLRAALAAAGRHAAPVLGVWLTGAAVIGYRLDDLAPDPAFYIALVWVTGLWILFLLPVSAAVEYVSLKKSERRIDSLETDLLRAALVFGRKRAVFMMGLWLLLCAGRAAIGYRHGFPAPDGHYASFAWVTGLSMFFLLPVAGAVKYVSLKRGMAYGLGNLLRVWIVLACWAAAQTLA